MAESERLHQLRPMRLVRNVSAPEGAQYGGVGVMHSHGAPQQQQAPASPAGLSVDVSSPGPAQAAAMSTVLLKRKTNRGSTASAPTTPAAGATSSSRITRVQRGGFPALAVNTSGESPPRGSAPTTPTRYVAAAVESPRGINSPVPVAAVCLSPSSSSQALNGGRRLKKAISNRPRQLGVGSGAGGAGGVPLVTRDETSSPRSRDTATQIRRPQNLSELRDPTFLETTNSSSRARVATRGGFPLRESVSEPYMAGGTPKQAPYQPALSPLPMSEVDEQQYRPHPRASGFDSPHRSHHNQPQQQQQQQQIASRSRATSAADRQQHHQPMMNFTQHQVMMQQQQQQMAQMQLQAEVVEYRYGQSHSQSQSQCSSRDSQDVQLMPLSHHSSRQNSPKNAADAMGSRASPANSKPNDMSNIMSDAAWASLLTRYRRANDPDRMEVEEHVRINGNPSPSNASAKGIEFNMSGDTDFVTEETTPTNADVVMTEAEGSHTAANTANANATMYINLDTSNPAVIEGHIKNLQETLERLRRQGGGDRRQLSPHQHSILV